MGNPVTVEANDSHFLLRMDDGKANALSFAMFEGLNAALDQAEAAGKVVIITGRNGLFSAGFDLSVMGEGGDARERLLRQGAALSARLMDFPLPVIAAVNGHCLAMGALLGLSVDYRVGALGNYKLGLNEVAIGMTMPWFGLALANARLARHHVDRAVGLACIYDPEGAVDAGYLDEAVAEAALHSRAVALAEQFAKLDFAAHRATKARVREAFSQEAEKALQRDFSSGAPSAG